MAETIFSRIIRREIPASIVYEDEHYLAFRDIAPQAPVHVLVIPKEPVRSLAEATDASAVGGLLLVAAAVARQEGIEESGYRVVLNTNGDGGQTVFHLHAHVLGGRPLHWPPG
ncbi:MAG: histidine triad nucleotide-binding protein [Gemmatimonadaceae bacterium]|jgi:histidine triad (HIT) family protein|nr:histidine triad nucleotide-binding protein [Gemmatimonadaceae bacterium]